MITLADLTARYGDSEIASLTDRQSYETIDETVVAQAIADAEGEVESYLNSTGLVSRNNRGRLIYRNDQPVPAVLLLKACDIARYYLHEEGVTGIVKERYEQAISWLKLVQKNPSMLTGTNDGMTNTAQPNSGVYVIPSPVPSVWGD